MHRYAREHDKAVWETLLALLDQQPNDDLEANKRRAQLPCRLGGLGLRCSTRTAPAAYWAAWADALPTLKERFPVLTAGIVAELEENFGRRHCLREVLRAARELRAENWETPPYTELAEGLRPAQPAPGETDPGEWRHGWQYFASRAREEYYLQHEILPNSSPPVQALLRSQAGRNCARALTAVPSDPALKMQNARFRTALCRRLRLPLTLLRKRCEGCGATLDALGDHYAACMRSGRVQARAKPVERTWARVLREAGASTKEQHLLCNSTLPVDPGDNRRMDVVATGTSLYHGRVLFCDATVRSPLKGNGQPHPRAATKNGAVLRRAKQDKEKKYRDLVSSPLAELLVLACEVGDAGTTKPLN